MRVESSGFKRFGFEGVGFRVCGWSGASRGRGVHGACVGLGVCDSKTLGTLKESVNPLTPF